MYRQRFFFHDDAFISLRYAVQLANFGELTWNLGERVEGYTNFLQIMATAGLTTLGFDPVAAVRSINAVAVVGLLVSTVKAARRLSPDDSIVVAVGGFLVMSSAPVALWTLGGLEAVMLAALIAAAITVVLPVFLVNQNAFARSLSAGLLIGLAYLTRPDALIVGAALFLGLCCFLRGNPWHRIRLAGVLAAATSAIVLPHMIWRITYYGDWLPNTFYAKIALLWSQRLLSGGLYVLSAVSSFPVILLASVGLVWTIRTRKVNPVVSLLSLTILAYLLYVIWAGGDHMPGARWLVPLVAPASLLVVIRLANITDLKRRTAYGATIVLIGLVGAMTFPQQRMDKAAFVGSLVGKYISSTWPSGALVALHTAGSTPYLAAHMRFIDMLGLNDRAIAHRSPIPMRAPWQSVPGHAKGDGAYVLRRAPSYIVAGPAEGRLVDSPWFLSDVELGESEEFRRCYVAETIMIPYTEEMARRGPETPHPLTFTYYKRSCPPTEN